jgi:hypothetical protein
MKTITTNLVSLFNKKLFFISLSIGIVLMMHAVTYSQPFNNPASVPLLTAETYGALAYSGIPGSAIVNGDGGTTTGTIGGITFTGINYGVGGDHNSQAQIDLTAALTNISSRTNDVNWLPIQDLAGMTLTHGVYGGPSSLNISNNGTLILNAENDPNAIFIIKAASTLDINTGATISLINGAVWSNVFWYVGTSATIFSGTTFNGIVLANVSITLNTGAALVTAQLLANTGAVTINSDVLPVELTSFTAVSNNKTVELNWSSATELNNVGFEVERSSLSENNNSHYAWIKIGFVNGAGNSHSPKIYSYVDNDISQSKYAYRLKQIDTDGNFEYSSIIEVFTGQIPNAFLLNQNYPNPFNPSTIIEFGVDKNTAATLTVHNVIGEKIATLFNGDLSAGQIYSVPFNGGKFASGIYYYKLQTNERNEVKKMFLLK